MGKNAKIDKIAQMAKFAQLKCSGDKNVLSFKCSDSNAQIEYNAQIEMYSSEKILR